MALPESVEPLQHPFADAPILAPDDLEQARREAAEREDLKRQIDFAIDEINTNPNIPSELKTELVNNLRSLKTGLGANPNLAQVQKEINDARAAVYQASATSTIYNALNEGRFADYYFNAFDPDNRLDSETRTFIAQRINNNPEIQANFKAVQALGPEKHREIEAEFERNRKFVEERIAAVPGSEREHFEKVRRYNLDRIPGVVDELRNASPEELSGIIDQATRVKVELAQPILQQFGPNTDQGRYLRLNGDGKGDGYGFAVDVAQLLEIGSSEEGIAALVALRRAGGNFNALPAHVRPLAAAALFTQEANANFLPQTAMLQTIKNIARATETEVGHNQHLDTILDNQAPFEDRVRLMAEELQEHGGDSMKNLSLGARMAYARQFISQVNLLSNPRETILGRSNEQGFNALEYLGIDDLSAHFTQETQRAQLLHYGFNAAQAEALVRLSTDPSLAPTFSGALRVLDPLNPMYGEQERSAIRQKLVQAAAIAVKPIEGEPAPPFHESLSKIRYYNLSNTEMGSRILSDIVTGNLDPATATAAVNALQQQTLLQMQQLVPLVPAMLNPEQQPIERLTRLGMIAADGTLDVERLIETARINRDKLDGSDAAIAARSNIPWSELTEEQRDTRVIAQAAIRFKAIDAIQSFGAEIDAAYARIGRDESRASADLRNDIAQYRAMLDTTNPEAQRVAIDSLLQRQQYLRVNEALRHEVAANIIDLSQSHPELLRNSELISSSFATDRNANIPALPTPSMPLPRTPTTVAAPGLTIEEVRALASEGNNNLGDSIFQNTIEDRIKKALKGKTMGEIVAIFRNNVTGEDLIGASNVGRLDNISVNEIENALAANGKTRLEQIDTNGDRQLSIEEIIAGLRMNGELSSSVANAQGVASNSTPPAQAVPGSSGPATPASTPGR